MEGFKIQMIFVVGRKGESMSELIYKQDAKDAVDMALDTIDHVPEWVYDILLNSLDKVPSAEPDKDLIHLQKEQAYMQGYEDGRKSRKKGKWIDNTFCSECGWVHEVESGFIGSVKQFNFCPNCGADMRESVL